MYKNYCDDDWDDESESEYYVQDYRTPNDDDPPSGSVNENDADLRLFEQTYDISSHQIGTVFIVITTAWITTSKYKYR